MKPSPSAARFVLAFAFLFALSLGLKVFIGPPEQPGGRTDPRLGDLISAASDRPARPVADGWRADRADGCWLMAFPSGAVGMMDLWARSHAKKPDRIGYVYQGQVRDTPPTARYALDVIAYRLQRPFRPVRPPGYLVLVAPRACGAWPALPWERFS